MKFVVWLIFTIFARPAFSQPEVWTNYDGTSVNSLSLTRPRADAVIDRLFMYRAGAAMVGAPVASPLQVIRWPIDGSMTYRNHDGEVVDFVGKVRLSRQTSLLLKLRNGVYEDATIEKRSFLQRLVGANGRRISLLTGSPVHSGPQHAYSVDRGRIEWGPEIPNRAFDMTALFHEQGHENRLSSMTSAEKKLLTELYGKHGENYAVYGKSSPELERVILGHERDAWAFALRKVRSLRAQGVDPLPGVNAATLREEVRFATSTYVVPPRNSMSSGIFYNAGGELRTARPILDSIGPSAVLGLTGGDPGAAGEFLDAAVQNGGPALTYAFAAVGGGGMMVNPVAAQAGMMALRFGLYGIIAAEMIYLADQTYDIYKSSEAVSEAVDEREDLNIQLRAKGFAAANDGPDQGLFEHYYYYVFFGD
jgi:hypothetical protein